MSDNDITPETPEPDPEEQRTAELPQADASQQARSAASVPVPAGRPRLKIGRKPLLAGVGAVAVLIIAGSVGYALGDNGSSSSHPASAAPESHHRHMHRGAGGTPAAFGTIAGENADVWTLTKPDGTTLNITLNGDTRFGTREHAETRDQFAVGNQIAVRGKATGQDSITARWIGLAADLPHHHGMGGAPQPGGDQAPPQAPGQPPTPTS
jgi:hypothetical protein